MLDPSHRYIAALAKVRKAPKKFLGSTCPLEKLLAQEQTGTPVVANALYRAYSIFIGKRNSKIIMGSLLFCMEDKKELNIKIVKHMNVAKMVPEHYVHYFFDSSVFEDMFDRLDYIEALADRDPSDFNVKDKVTKQLAITEGFYYIISYFKGGVLDYTAAEYTKRLLSIANKYVAQAQNTGILSKESDKLFRWMQMAAKLAISIKDLREDSVDDALQDIRIALEYDCRPSEIEVLPPEDVLRG